MKKCFVLISILFCSYNVHAQNKILKNLEKIDSTKISYDNSNKNASVAFVNDTLKQSKILVLIDDKFYSINDKEFKSLDKNKIKSMEIFINTKKQYNFEKLIVIKLKK